MQPTTPKIILLAFALIAVFMPYAFTAEYSSPYDPGAARLNGNPAVNFSIATTYSGYFQYPSMTFDLFNSAFSIRQICLADDEAESVQAILGTTAFPNGSIRIVNIGPYSNAGGEVLITGSNNTATAITDYGNLEAADTDVNVCVYSSGGGGYILKNRIGAIATYSLIYQGEK